MALKAFSGGFCFLFFFLPYLPDKSCNSAWLKAKDNHDSFTVCLWKHFPECSVFSYGQLLSGVSLLVWFFHGVRRWSSELVWEHHGKNLGNVLGKSLALILMKFMSNNSALLIWFWSVLHCNNLNTIICPMKAHGVWKQKFGVGI